MAARGQVCRAASKERSCSAEPRGDSASRHLNNSASFKEMKTKNITTLFIRNSLSRSPMRRAFLRPGRDRLTGAFADRASRSARQHIHRLVFAATTVAIAVQAWPFTQIALTAPVAGERAVQRGEGHPGPERCCGGGMEQARCIRYGSALCGGLRLCQRVW